MYSSVEAFRKYIYLFVYLFYSFVVRFTHEGPDSSPDRARRARRATLPPPDGSPVRVRPTPDLQHLDADLPGPRQAGRGGVLLPADGRPRAVRLLPGHRRLLGSLRRPSDGAQEALPQLPLRRGGRHGERPEGESERRVGEGLQTPRRLLQLPGGQHSPSGLDELSDRCVQCVIFCVGLSVRAVLLFTSEQTVFFLSVCISSFRKFIISNSP